MSDRALHHTTFKQPLNVGAAILPGSPVLVDLRNLPTEIGGRPCYVSSIDITGTFSITNASGGALDTYAQPLRALSQVKLSVPGHEFLDGVDGEDIAIDGALLGAYNSKLAGSAQSIANAVGADNYNVECKIFASRASADDEIRYDGCIPCVLLKHGDSSFGFQLIESIGVPLATMKVTNAKLTAIFHLVVRDDLVEPSPWKIAKRHDPSLTATIENRGGLHYAIVNVRDPAATALTPLNHATGISSMTLEVDGQMIFNTFTQTEIDATANAHRSRLYTDALQGMGYGTSWRGTPVLVHPGDSRLTKLTRGPLTLTINGSRPSTWDNRTSILYRCTGIRDPGVSARWRAAMGLTGATTYVVDSVQGGGKAAGPTLPARLINPNVPAHARRRGAERAQGIR